MNLDTAPVDSVPKTIEPSKAEKQNTNRTPNETLNNVSVSKVDASVNESKTKKKKKVVKKTAPAVDFSTAVVNVINELRANPSAFAEKIEALIENIKEDKGKQVYKTKGVTMRLNTGEAAFRSAAEKLRNTAPSAPLSVNTEIAVPVPENQEEWRNAKAITATAQQKEQATKSKITANVDQGVSDPETFVLLQVVDDSPFKGTRSKNILDPANKSIAVTSLQQEKKFCAIMVFAKDA